MCGIDLLPLRNFENSSLITGWTNLSPPSQAEWGAALGNYTEDIESRDPFRATFTFSIGDESLALTVDEQLEVRGIALPMIPSSMTDQYLVT